MLLLTRTVVAVDAMTMTQPAAQVPSGQGRKNEATSINHQAMMLDAGAEAGRAVGVLQLTVP